MFIIQLIKKSLTHQILTWLSFVSPKKKNDHHSFIIKSYKFEHWKILNKGLNLKVSKIIPEKKKIGWTHMQKCPKHVPVQYVSNMDSGHMTRSEVFESQKHFLNQVWDLRDVLTSGTKYWGWCTRVGTLAYICWNDEVDGNAY